MISNRQLILPYAAPYLTYVFLASVLPNHLPTELNYLMRIAVCLGALVWAWKWYVPITGPGSTFISVLVGIIAGFIGLVLWIILVTPFSNSIDNVAWSGQAFILRLLSAGFLVPVFEEILMRGFVFRLALQWGQTKKKESLLITLDEKSINDVAPGDWSWIAVVISTLVFTSGHHMYEWPASIAFGLLMAFLWILRKDLIVCIVAHSVTNISLALYVLKTDSWYLW